MKKLLLILLSLALIFAFAACDSTAPEPVSEEPAAESEISVEETEAEQAQEPEIEDHSADVCGVWAAVSFEENGQTVNSDARNYAEMNASSDGSISFTYVRDGAILLEETDLPGQTVAGALYEGCPNQNWHICYEQGQYAADYALTRPGNEETLTMDITVYYYGDNGEESESVRINFLPYAL